MRALFLLLLSLASLLALSSAQQCGTQANDKLCNNGLCCSRFGFCGSTSPFCCEGCQSQCDRCLTHVFNSSLFDEFLPPDRNEVICPASRFYTFDAFLAAADTFPGFGTTGDSETRKREIAAFFGQTSHETSARLSLLDFTLGYCRTSRVSEDNYCVPCNRWPCVEGQRYFPRGPMMLTHNYNYGPAGFFIGSNLLSNPSLVAEDPVVAFKTAIWLWMTPQPGRPSCHDVIVGNYRPTEADVEANRLPGYGLITNIINGQAECGQGINLEGFNRIGYYRRYCDIFGISYGNNLGCFTQQPFPSAPPPCVAGPQQSKAIY